VIRQRKGRIKRPPLKRRKKGESLMWFILEKKTEKTIAMTAFKDIAEDIAASFPTECVIRYAAGIDSGYGKDSTFFAVEEEEKKGA
jgi:hypothetical protein